MFVKMGVLFLEMLLQGTEDFLASNDRFRLYKCGR
ncbi:MAG: hypothetical protein JWN45_2845 [Acidobacteriaceae bacterium]|nr:hypothetical protein [Acidobacteriaceae bacterium]